MLWNYCYQCVVPSGPKRAFPSAFDPDPGRRFSSPEFYPLAEERTVALDENMQGMLPGEDDTVIQ